MGKSTNDAASLKILKQSLLLATEKPIPFELFTGIADLNKNIELLQNMRFVKLKLHNKQLHFVLKQKSLESAKKSVADIELSNEDISTLKSNLQALISQNDVGQALTYHKNSLEKYYPAVGQHDDTHSTHVDLMGLTI